MSEIIEIIPGSRLRVEQDSDNECPRGDWHMLTGFVKIGMRGDSRLSDVPAVHDDKLGISDALYRFGDVGHGAADALTAEDLAVRWARAFHGVVIEYDSEHGGYWFVAIDGPDLFAENWPDLKLGTPEHLAKQAEVIKQERETYRQWAEGEVYGVTLERTTLWGKLSADGSTLLQGEGTVREEWEEGDSLWGCYLDDTYTARAVALENFDLTEDEAAACRS